ncbi:MAG: hypothetical protein Q8M88_16445 [Phenylobacterium sp.]|uniref:hypothetical protein n=1 Tax=Phenylobacterium sp. TaxID=1871053 RepID=UPI0027333808|nr:hypothetical protein [Phenylobacterium sp.]MDP3176019.1 hypothetical protein [Phenylobacterium sp.]
MKPSILIAVALGLASFAGSACAQSIFDAPSNDPNHQPRYGSQPRYDAPGGYAPYRSTSPYRSQQPAFKPYEGFKPYEPYKPFKPGSVYSNRGGIDAYPAPVKPRKPKSLF